MNKVTRIGLIGDSSNVKHMANMHKNATLFTNSSKVFSSLTLIDAPFYTRQEWRRSSYRLSRVATGYPLSRKELPSGIVHWVHDRWSLPQPSVRCSTLTRPSYVSSIKTCRSKQPIEPHGGMSTVTRARQNAGNEIWFSFFKVGPPVCLVPPCLLKITFCSTSCARKSCET